MTELKYDEILNIQTGEDPKRFHNSFHYHPYEPTPYSALRILFNQYELKSSDRLVDFGCGKGRLNFLVHHLFHAGAVGIEMDGIFYQKAIENKANYFSKRKKGKDQIHFCCCLAEEYEINPADNRFYFFNPLSIQIFRKVVDNILISVENSYRGVELILYYPSEDYIFFLENDTAFELKQEVILPGLIDKDPSERFLIYMLR